MARYRKLMIIRIATVSAGYAFLAFGVIGIIVPVLHGMLFLVVGLALLARHEPWARAVLERLKRQHPRVRAIIDRGERLTQRWFRLALVRIGRWFKPARAG
ncbi:MAG: PGPGW domain-containing protein [Geminicoccaceae bacterium]